MDISPIFVKFAVTTHDYLPSSSRVQADCCQIQAKEMNNKMVRNGWWVILALFFVGCANQNAEHKEESETPTEQTQASDSPEPETCELQFEEKFSDEAKDNKTVTFFVSNFGGETNSTCWKNVEDYAQNVAGEKGKNTQVYFFNCKHHIMKVNASDPKVEGEYRDYCVARLDISPDGKKTFNKLPYEKKNS